MKTDLKLALVTDIHNGPDYHTKRGTRALDLLDRFCTFAQDREADFVVDMGDRISDVDRETDLGHLRAVADRFSRLSVPRGHILGNHDHENLSPEDNRSLLGCDMGSRVVTVRGICLVLWQANTRGFWNGGPSLESGDLDWLAGTLARAAGPCIIFTHVPLDSGSMAGNHYFDQAPRFATYPDAARIRRVIRESGKVVACVAGHVHWNTVNRVDGIPYFALHSLTESSTTFPGACGAWAELDLGEDIGFRVYGKDPMDVRVPLPEPGPSYLPPLLPGFARAPRERGREALHRIKAVFFDLDGVVYEGDRSLPGSREVIAALEQKGLTCMAITNNSGYRPEDISGRLADMGIALPVERILTVNEITARYLTEGGRTPTIHILGSRALKETLRTTGIEESETPEYVVVGWEDTLTVRDLTRAVAMLQRGAVLMATNGDATIPGPGGRVPETGSLVAFLERASGCRTEIVGKPHPRMFKAALDASGISAGEALMVGDTLETDILGAASCGMKTVYLCRTPDLNKHGVPLRPTVTISSLEELPALLSFP